jgi:hypothetical protein
VEGAMNSMIDDDISDDDDMFDRDDEDECPRNKRGHSFVVQEAFDSIGEGRCYCEFCGADGDA